MSIIQLIIRRENNASLTTATRRVRNPRAKVIDVTFAHLLTQGLRPFTACR